MVKSILYEGTIALGTSMDSRKEPSPGHLSSTGLKTLVPPVDAAGS